MDVKAIISHIDEEIAKLTKARDLLSGAFAKRGPGRPRPTTVAQPAAKKKKKAKSKMSAEGRARIAAAQKARWAKLKAKK